MMQKSLNNCEKVFGKSLCTEKVKYFFQPWPCNIFGLWSHSSHLSVYISVASLIRTLLVRTSPYPNTIAREQIFSMHICLVSPEICVPYPNLILGDESQILFVNPEFSNRYHVEFPYLTKIIVVLVMLNPVKLSK